MARGGKVKFTTFKGLPCGCEGSLTFEDIESPPHYFGASGYAKPKLLSADGAFHLEEGNAVCLHGVGVS